ncbi:nickel pincer cofactor biosynthesis protein LarC [Methanoculleus oceani]|uniref:Putative nickel insertion protein n=1 Tax=Methanoculleus oceani TaxID=2184756 RepID=A0ABD4T9F5_9EURY|nr:nickel pincer cofactor biosynthesis protein LarC [Methanoculleus sp. CWC-02]MCM2464727.1 nickel pincer cofactor biosynthesis protein LarC [Methanoculleus sp. CWC-02]
MNILLFDPFNGAAGDMIIGTLLDLGADEGLVRAAMRSVVGEPTIERVDRSGIRAVWVRAHAPVDHRTLDEVLDRVAESDAPAPAREMARRVFLRIHRAEESIHGTGAHFHEVGADDAVADVVGACTALHSLGVAGVAVLPVALGRGFAVGAHGTFPIPAPATVAVLAGSDLKTVPGNEERELCTPTGAALLAEFSTLRSEDLGPAAIRAVGYGAGSRNPPGKPNVIRSMLLSTEEHAGGDRVDILETNVDDVTGEALAYTIGRLMEEGARDASATPAVMKKGRSGHLVRVISPPDATDRLVGVMAAELGTLGIRCIPMVHRSVAERTIEPVTVTIRDRERTIDVKCGWSGGKITSFKAEYEQAAACARETGVPLREVAGTVEAAARRLFIERGVLAP